jgi:hypothetical protein
MTSQRQAETELTAKQRLALSRYALVIAAAVEVEGPLWVDLLRLVARRCLHRQGLKRDQVR